MKAPSHLVLFKDGPSDQILFFGPFVSESVADFFTAALPTPQEGGWVHTKPLQPYTAQEGHTVNQLIMAKRQGVLADH